MICHEINTENDFRHDSQPSDFNLDQNLRNGNNIPSTLLMIQSFDTSDQSSNIVALDKHCISEDDNISRHDLINPVIEGRIPSDLYKEINLSQISTSLDKNITNQANDVDWENMFDSELFSTEAAIANAHIELEQIETPVANTFNIQFPGKAKKTCEIKTKRNCDKPNDEDNKNGKKIKRKNPPITDAIQKKVKKVTNEPKISFRKQKYIKTVKNWLNEVDPTNPVEINECKDQNETRAQTEIIIEKAKEKSNKKVVQAQLANKDGIMKFRKPKREITKKLESDKTDQSTLLIETNIIKKLKTPETNKVDKMNKEKTHKENRAEKTTKNKPKFMVPIKSQIPIKDIVYRVTTLEENNIGDHINALNRIENHELVFVLIYR